MAQGAVTAVEQLRDVLVGNPQYSWDHGRLGRSEEKFDKFVADSAARDKVAESNLHFRISNRLGAITVIVMAIGILASIVITLVK